jgi:CDP-diacylglycerol--serine O-phosphatidyltransferase
MRTNADIIILTVFICCGIARLARFNATVALAPKDATGKAKFFEGLPIPTSLGLVALMSECVRRDWIEGPGLSGQGLPGGLILPLKAMGLEVHWVAVLMLGWAMAFISKSLKVPKP